jgi:hypothetical protein
MNLGDLGLLTVRVSGSRVDTLYRQRIWLSEVMRPRKCLISFFAADIAVRTATDQSERKW